MERRGLPLSILYTGSRYRPGRILSPWGSFRRGNARCQTGCSEREVGTSPLFPEPLQVVGTRPDAGCAIGKSDHMNTITGQPWRPTGFEGGEHQHAPRPGHSSLRRSESERTGVFLLQLLTEGLADSYFDCRHA